MALPRVSVSRFLSLNVACSVNSSETQEGNKKVTPTQPQTHTNTDILFSKPNSPQQHRKAVSVKGWVRLTALTRHKERLSRQGVAVEVLPRFISLSDWKHNHGSERGLSKRTGPLRWATRWKLRQVHVSSGPGKVLKGLRAKHTDSVSLSRGRPETTARSRTGPLGSQLVALWRNVHLLITLSIFSQTNCSYFNWPQSETREK